MFYLGILRYAVEFDDVIVRLCIGILASRNNKAHIRNGVSGMNQNELREMCRGLKINLCKPGNVPVIYYWLIK